MSNISPDELVQDAHEEWLHHPITQMLLRNLDKHGYAFVKNGITHASDYGTSEEHFRGLFNSIKNTEAIKQMIINFNTFHNLSQTK